MDGGVDANGAGSLARTLDDAADRLDDFTDAEHAAGQLLTTKASAAAPVATGALAQAHGYTVTPAGLTVTAARPYAAPVHAFNPWLARTLTAAEGPVLDLYAADAETALSVVKGT